MGVATDPLRGLPAARQIQALKKWAWIHKWTSLVCTVFLLVICLTGLLLVFSDEIDHWATPRTYEALPADSPTVSIDRLTGIGRQMYPGQIVSAVSLSMTRSHSLRLDGSLLGSTQGRSKDRALHPFRLPHSEDSGTVQTTGTAPRRFHGRRGGLHEDLFIGLPGELFLGFMALLFVAAIVSGWCSMPHS